MPRSRDVSVILTLCEYGDYLYTDIQTARESQSSDDCAVIIKMLGSVRPWSFALEKYMREIGALFEWSFDRRQHGPHPATPMYDSLKMEAESRGMGRKELTDRIKAYVERRNQYCDNSIQNLIMSKSWEVLAKMLYADLATTCQYHESAKAQAVQVVHSAIHRIKDEWFDYIRPVPARSGIGGLNLEAPALEFKVREDADTEVERRQRQGKVTFAMNSSEFIEGEAFYFDGLGQGRCTCEIRAQELKESARRATYVERGLDDCGRDASRDGNSSHQ